MLFPANPGRGLLLPFVGRSLAIPGAGPCRCCSPPILAGPAAGFGWLGRHSPLLAEVSVVLFPAIPGLGQLLALLVLVVPRHSRQRQGAGFGELGGPSPTLAEVSSAAACCHSSLGPPLGFGAFCGPSPDPVEGPVGAVLGHSWLGSAAGFGGVDCPSSSLAEGSVGAFRRQSWLGSAAAFGG